MLLFFPTHVAVATTLKIILFREGFLMLLSGSTYLDSEEHYRVSFRFRTEARGENVRPFLLTPQRELSRYLLRNCTRHTLITGYRPINGGKFGG